MWTMGDDFQYQYAESWFKQMDKLIHYVNKVQLQYKHFFRISTINKLALISKKCCDFFIQDSEK